MLFSRNATEVTIMPLDRKVVDALKANACEESAQIDVRAKKINDLMVEQDVAEDRLRALIHLIQTEDPSFRISDAMVERPERPVAPGKGASSLPQGGSFRDQIIRAVRRLERPAKPAEVEESLLALGFQEPEDMKTPLRIRLGNELSKLVKSGQLDRDPSGGGYIAPE
jgi:hypothetical protein